MGKTPLFILGTGFIGGSLLTDLLKSGEYEITALQRSKDKAEQLEKLGVRAVLGELDSRDVIVKETKQADIIIHAATADDELSVKAILEGLSQKTEDQRAPVYIHTSGTGVISFNYDGSTPTDKVYSDKDTESMDALDPKQPHRNVDLLIKNAVESRAVKKAKVAIILPPLIYGIGTGPFNKTSIQVPGWMTKSVQDKQVKTTGSGVTTWHHIHVANLVSAYRVLLSHLEEAKSQSSLYWFAETGHHTWLSLAESLRDALEKRGLVEHEIGRDDEPSYMGSNSRSSADKLRELGWKGNENTSLSVWDSVDSEVEEILKSGQMKEFESR